MKSPVRKNRPLGSVRGAPGNWRPYLDVRSEKNIMVAKRRLGVFFDLYNMFNANPETSITAASGTSWLRPLVIVPPRIAKFGMKFDW